MLPVYPLKLEHDGCGIFKADSSFSGDQFPDYREEADEVSFRAGMKTDRFYVKY